MTLSNYKSLFFSKKWLIAGLVCFALFASYAGAVGFKKDPEVGVMVPVNDYEPAWYINPGTKEKLYIGQPIDVFRVMRKFGVGIKHATLQEYFKKGFPKNLAGKILLDVESKGQAYYISPADLKSHFLGQPNFALLVLRENGFLLSKEEPDIKLNNPLAEERKRALEEKALADKNLAEANKIIPEVTIPMMKELTVTTEPISANSGFSKIIAVSASVSNEANLTITERGVVWGFSSNPSISNNVGVAQVNVETDNFSVNIDNIVSGKTYYIKAYVLVGDKAYYGNEEIFTAATPVLGGGSAPVAISVPSLTTNNLVFSSASSLSSGGVITSDGGGAITSKGICFSAVSNPTISDTCTDEVGTGNNFDSSLSGLDSETIYYVRAYATNSKGTGYGNEVVTCDGATVNDIEGNPYNVVKIGSQCWLKENLHLGTMIGAALADGVTAQGQSNNSVIEKFCYGYVQQGDVTQIATGTANCITDGGLYEWPEAMGLPYDCKNAPSVDNGDGTYTLSCPTSGSQTISAKQRGICPAGWHIPAVNDYQMLSQRFDPGCDLISSGCTTAGGKLKATPTYSPIAWDGTDIYNFSVMPTGYLYYLTFSHHRDHAPFWTTSPDLSNPVNSWGFGLTAASATAYSDPGNNRTDGFSVRCVKD